jgi:hypothetical protein
MPYSSLGSSPSMLGLVQVYRPPIGQIVFVPLVQGIDRVFFS